MNSFKQFLVEMPMGIYHAHQKDQNTLNRAVTTRPTFSKNDIKVITHPKTFITLERVLARSTKHTFNILLDSSLNEVNVKQYCQENNIPIEGRITFAKNSSTGGLMTSWMILHTLGHALVEHHRDMGLYIRNYINEIAGMDGVITITDKDTIRYVAKYLKFKSARKSNDYFAGNNEVKTTNRLSDIGELVNELIAEYLWHGYIRHDPKITTQIKTIESIINQYLNKSVGTIIMDYYA